MKPTKEQNVKWNKQLNFHLENPKKLQGQGVIEAESPTHQEWLERAYLSLKKKYDIFYEAPRLFIIYASQV